MGQKGEKIIGEIASVAVGATSSWMGRAVYSNEWKYSTNGIFVLFIASFGIKLYFLLRHETLEETMGKMTAMISKNNQKALQVDSEIAVTDKETILELSTKIREAVRVGNFDGIETLKKLQEQLGTKQNGQ